MLDFMKFVSVYVDNHTNDEIEIFNKKVVEVLNKDKFNRSKVKSKKIRNKKNNKEKNSANSSDSDDNV